jgi:hypothetical protein
MLIGALQLHVSLTGYRNFGSCCQEITALSEHREHLATTALQVQAYFILLFLMLWVDWKL